MEERHAGTTAQQPLTRRQLRELAEQEQRAQASLPTPTNVSTTPAATRSSRRASAASPTSPAPRPQVPEVPTPRQPLTRAQLRALENAQRSNESTTPPAPQPPADPHLSPALAELQALAAQTASAPLNAPKASAPSVPTPHQPRATARTRRARAVQATAASPASSITPAPSTTLVRDKELPAHPSAATPAPAVDPSVANILAEVNAVVARVEAALVAPNPHPTQSVLILGSGRSAATPTSAPSASSPLSAPAPSFLSVVTPQTARSATSPHGALTSDAQCHQPVRSAVSPAIAQPHGHLPLDDLLAPSSSVGVEKRQISRERSERTASGSQRWMSRFAVLGSIAAATIAAPILMGGAQTDAPIFADAQPVEYDGPNTVDVVAAGATTTDVPAGIAQSVSEDQRAYLVASRSEQREVLEGCESGVRPAGTNGQLATSDLCRVMNNQYLRADAAIALAALNEQYQARFGHAMCVTDGYRTLSTQYTLKATKGSLAATPGTSNHGWGLAIDICPDTYQAWDKWNWLKENAPTYGWAQPGWASRSYEPWHWEYTAGVEEMASR